MPMGRKIKQVLIDYCDNTSLVGFGYISNRKIHITERIFWLICITLTTGGSYYLIREYQKAFESEAISLVIEGTRAQDKAEFPTVAVCEIGFAQESYPAVLELVKRFGEETGIGYQSASEDYLLRVIFPNTYYHLSLQAYCERPVGCPNCSKCPASGYKSLAKQVRRNCSQLMLDCYWNGKAFPCCDYFLPLQTPGGLCFLLNSIHTTSRGSPRWLKTEIGWDAGHGEMYLGFKAPVDSMNPLLQLINEEDVPSNILFDNRFFFNDFGLQLELLLTMQQVTNDPDIREVSPDYRKCRFPDENLKDSAYNHYSYRTCIADCIKQLQLQICGCNSHNLLVKSDDKSPSCGYKGFICLDHADLIRPPPRILQPWNLQGPTCNCLPSCTEHEISVIQKTRKDVRNSWNVSIRQLDSTQIFRRQAVRTHLDVVVTIGGILGLFMGASILSGIELFYFFFIRLFYSRN